MLLLRRVDVAVAACVCCMQLLLLQKS